MSCVGSLAEQISECCSALCRAQLRSLNSSDTDSTINSHIDNYSKLLKCFSDAAAKYDVITTTNDEKNYIAINDSSDRYDSIGSILPVLITDLSLIDEISSPQQLKLQEVPRATIEQLLICAMDVLSWICNGDVVYPLRNSSLDDGFRANCTDDQINSLPLQIIKCVSFGSLGVKFSALFLLVEQQFPLVYKSVVDSLIPLLSEMIAVDNTEIIRKNSLKCIGKICKQIRSEKYFSPHHSTLDLPPELMSHVYLSLTDSSETIRDITLKDVISYLDVFQNIDKNIIEYTQQFTNYLHSLLKDSASAVPSEPNSPENLKSPAVYVFVSTAWRTWITLIPPGSLMPLLRSGSTGVDTAGYLLRPIEKLLNSKEGRIFGCKSWHTLVERLTLIKNWTENDKIIKLLLRCISHLIDTETSDHAIVSTLGKSIDSLLSGSSSYAENILSFEYYKQQCLNSLLERYILKPECAAELISEKRTLSTEIIITRALVATRCFYFTSKLTTDELSLINKCFGKALFSISRGVQLPSMRHIDSVLQLFGFATQAIAQLHTCFSLQASTLEFHTVNTHLAVGELLTCIVGMWQYAIMQIVSYLVSKKADYKTMESPQVMNSETENDTATGIILTMDSDGYNYGVLSSTSQSSSHLLEQIFSELSLIMIQYMMSEFGDKYYVQRELIIESIWWLLHRLSAFDNNIKAPIVVSLIMQSLEYFKLDRNVGFPSLPPSEEDSGNSSGAVPLALAPALSIALLHAARLDAKGGSEAEPQMIYYALKRCVKSIVECRILPTAMNWIPSVFKNIISTRSSDVNTKHGTSCNNLFIVRAIGCFAAGTINLLSEMPVDISGDRSSDPSYNIVLSETVTGLQNILSLPLLILQYDIQLIDIFWGVEQFLTYDLALDNLNNQSLLDDSLKYWTALFEVLVDVIDLQTLEKYLKTFVKTDDNPKLQNGVGVLTAYRIIKAIIDTIQKKIKKNGKISHISVGGISECGYICSKLFLRIQNIWAETVIHFSCRISDSSSTILSDILSVDIAFYNCSIVSLSQHYFGSIDTSSSINLTDECKPPTELSRAINMTYSIMTTIEKHLVSKEPSPAIGFHQRIINTFLIKIVMAWSRCVSSYIDVTDGSLFFSILYETTERFVQSICLSTFFSSSLKSLLTSLLQEISSIRETNSIMSPSKSNTFKGTSKNLFIGNKRTFTDIKSPENDAVCDISPHHKKQQKYSENAVQNETQRIKISTPSSSLVSSYENGKIVARQWSGVPHLYSHLDRQDLNSQSQIEDTENKADGNDEIHEEIGVEQFKASKETTDSLYCEQCCFTNLKKLLDKIASIKNDRDDNLDPVCNCGSVEIYQNVLNTSSTSDLAESFDIIWNIFKQKHVNKI